MEKVLDILRVLLKRPSYASSANELNFIRNNPTGMRQNIFNVYFNLLHEKKKLQRISFEQRILLPNYTLYLYDPVSDTLQRRHKWQIQSSI